MKTLRELLEIELPIIQAPMAGVQGHALAVAVSEAGGLGSLPGAMLDRATLHQELTAITSQTSRRFNVNFFCHQPPLPDPAREAEWRKLLAPYYRELGIEDAAPSAAPSRAPFSHEVADVLEPFKPSVVSFHFGLPSPGLVARVHSWGAMILSTATTVEEALWLEAHGTDGIIAQGLEAGGHRGHFLSPDLARQMSTRALVSGIARHVKVPVIAAGGIADSKAAAAAMSLGAAGVQIGTAYLLCPEATTRSVHRAALKSPKVRPTALTNLFTGRAARGMVNRLMREMGPMNVSAPEFPLAAAALAPLRAKAEGAGRDDFSPLWAGENYADCRELPAAELTRILASDCG